MIGVHYYNETIKSAVAAFGSLFNNIVIRRKNGKVYPVAIAYGPRQKWIEGQKVHNRALEAFLKTTPRISYELAAMSYDQNRKITNKQTIIKEARNIDQDDARANISVPVPYTLDFSLYIETKNLNDGWQIIEQILPFFAPAYTLKVKHFPVDADSDAVLPTNTFDMPIVLTAVTWSDDWTQDIGDQRSVEWSLEFSAKINLAGPVKETTIITDSRVIASIPGINQSIDSITRFDSEQVGTEVGYVALNIGDSEGDVSYDSESGYGSFKLSPAIINTTDSDGNIVKIVRDINDL